MHNNPSPLVARHDRGWLVLVIQGPHVPRDARVQQVDELADEDLSRVGTHSG